MACEKSKILIVGATGYLGEYMVKASLSLGHPTFAYVRPIHTSTHLSKLHHLQSLGLTLFQGELDQKEKLVSCLQQVDVVISTLAVPQHLEQLKIIQAIKQAGNIKRFVPSEYGSEVDRVKGLPPFEALLENKRKIRRATEEARISYTYVSANSFAAYFLSYLLHPHDLKLQHLLVYGTGEAKAVLNYEEDVAFYTMKAATDERAENRVVIIRPEGNIISQLELITLWENRTNRAFKREHITKQEMVKLCETLDFPDNIAMAILHNVFVKGTETMFELSAQDVEASQLYPNYKYTKVNALLDACFNNPLLGGYRLNLHDQFASLFFLFFPQRSIRLVT
ncbi:isoeugenol synthase 1-like [Prosopis cineraria]|uniref:isoeugenol synthase 1-like n=1 Tax=Prosopis cineraria TaxID=364024 RepID=UPI00240F0224|nr:isoeugenol synthase 1-like [Prosopis cineraria]